MSGGGWVDAPELVIRPLAGLAEREACVALQRRVWGRGFGERVPASILMIAQETGGVASGAFLDGRLVGFVFGITGLRDGRMIHWSDMLAVAPEHRDAGIGFRLKRHQREVLLAQGVETALWTWDPLVARNAHVNLRRLGAIAREYRRDVYGASTSPLHTGIGTDRLLAEWPLGSERVRRRLNEDATPGEDGVRDSDEVRGDDVAYDPPAHADPGPVLNPPVLGGPVPRPSATLTEPDGPMVRIAVPADIQRLKSADLTTAVAWRKNVRAAFERAFEAGYTAVDVERPGGEREAGDPETGERGAGGEADAGAVARYVLASGFSL